jgi:RPA family protein
MAATMLTPDGKGERIVREVAQRVFAAEFQASTLEYKDGGDRAPTFVVTPLGARVNRILVVGVLTSNETVGPTGEIYKAQITDPTGIFHVYAGQYQPEAAEALANLRPPVVVAVVGKSRTYRPDAQGKPDVVYTSIRPETVVTLSHEDRDAWVIETARHTLLRLDCMKEASAMANPTAAALADLGYPKDLAEGAVRALAHYGKPDLTRWAATVRDAVEAILPGGSGPAMPVGFAPASALAAGHFGSNGAPRALGPAGSTANAPPATPAQPHPNDIVSDQQEQIEEEVFGFVEKLDDGKGAPWEEVSANAQKKRISESEVEEALNRLMDKGRIYEPVLGRLKKT